MPQHLNLQLIDYAILLIYFVFVFGIGWVVKRYMKGSANFFLSGRSILAWVTGLAFISANLGAQEVIGLAASGAKYGIMTSHVYWVGAIPAMVFLAIFMMPFYYGSRARWRSSWSSSSVGITARASPCPRPSCSFTWHSDALADRKGRYTTAEYFGSFSLPLVAWSRGACFQCN